MAFRPRHILYFEILLLLLPGAAATAQDSPSDYDYPYHHLPWYTLESEHFLVHFQQGNSRSAQVASRIAEEVYPHITKLYGTEPDSKTSIVLKDRKDYSNGAAYFFDNQIDIRIPSLDTPLRGSHNWMRNVISHEFTHIVQLKAAMKKSRKLPAVYLQWLSYEGVRRPDVLYGYPNGLITYPFSSISVPGWFAEGVAQYQRTGWTYDTWDSHRDMILRMALLHDDYLSFEEMGTFSSKTGLEREQVYNQGYAFTANLVLQHGEAVLKRISTALGKPGVFDVDRAIEMATGESGHKQYERWISEKKKFYRTAVEHLNPGESSLIESDGYLNLYPEFSPDGSKIAYLSNKKVTESPISLYIRESGKTGNHVATLDLGPVSNSRLTFRCGYNAEPLIIRIRSAFSFSPDGKQIVFSRTELNRYGESYNDLFIYRFDTDKQEQLTESARIHDPEWGPGGGRIAAIRIDRGTANLVLVDPETGAVRQLTRFEDGEQLYTPTWHPDGDEIYFSFSEQIGRSLKKINLKNGQVETVFGESYVDYRDPYIDGEGLFLYYSADPDGIFNIYRTPVGGKAGEREQLTGVYGGAFMPHLDSENNLLFSEYRNGGYNIVAKPLPQIMEKKEWGSYRPPLEAAPMIAAEIELPKIGTGKYDDSDIDPLAKSVMARADTGAATIRVPTADGPNERLLYGYREEFTSFSFYPTIRFDNYSKLNGTNASLLRTAQLGDLGNNLLRDLKIGTYFSSREVINRLGIFGGILFGPGSRGAEGIGDFFSPARLTDLDRDLFLITEYRGLPFIEKRWSPTLSVGLYNLRRNVADGLSVEEFPCTACLPDTTSVDIAYNIWEIDLSLKSKINAHSLLELGASFTPYRVQTDGFFSRELRQFIPSSSTEYFRGGRFSAGFIYENLLSYRHMDSAPIGMRATLSYAYEPGELLDAFEVTSGVLSPVYRSSNNHSVEISSRFGFKLGDRGTGQIRTRFFSYFNNPDDSFYADYIGGFTGMRSYPFFALGGNTTAFLQVSHIFPLLTGLHEQVGRHTFDKLFLRLFAETGNGWNSPLPTGNHLKTGLGAELRFSFNSYYLYPLKLFVSGSYGFNEFDVNLPSEFITETGSNRVTYGGELLIHFGLTFDFEIFNHD